MIAQRDWSGSLGPFDEWPLSLRTAVALILRSPVAMTLLWGEAGIMLYNDAYSRFAGGRHPDLMGMPVLEAWPEASEFNDRVMKTGLAGDTLQFRDQELILHRHGRPERVAMNLDYSPVIDDHGNPTGVLAVLVETTEKVAAERELRESEERLRLVIDSATDYAIFTTDPNRIITSWSAGAARIFGYDAPTAIGMSGDVLWTADDRAVGAPEREVLAARETGCGNDERWHLRSDGALVFLNGSVRPLPPAPDGSERGFIKIARDETERRKIEAVARADFERVRLALDAGAIIGTWFWDLPNDRFTVDREFAEAFGIDPALGREGLSLEQVTATVHPDDKAGLSAAIDEAVERGGRYAHQYRVRGRDGEYHWIEANGRVDKDPDGAPTLFSGVLLDVADRREMEAALRESEQRFRNMADNTPVMLWVTDLDGQCTYLNQRWYEYTGQAPGEGEGLGWTMAVHPDDRAKATEVFLEANGRQADYEVEFRLRRADGVYRWTLDAAAARFDAGGKFLGYVGSVIDIDERREAAEALRRGGELLRNVMEQMPIGVAVARIPSGEVIIYNRAMTELLGHEAFAGGTEDYGRYGGLHDDGTPFDASDYPLAKVILEDLEIADQQFRYRRPDGSIVHLRCDAARVRTAGGNEDLAVVAIQDVTLQKRSEQHQRLLIDELSHRAKNLLAIIQSVAQQSFRGARDPAEMLRAFEGRLGALAAAHGILTREKWESAPIRRIICDTITAVKSDDHRLTLDGPDLMVPPKTGVSLAMAIHELVTNALKYGSYSNDDGRVLVSWQVVDGRLKLEWREQGGPPVSVPNRRGFGSRMIERGLAAELGGAVRIDFHPDGVVCTVDAPMPDAA